MNPIFEILQQTLNFITVLFVFRDVNNDMMELMVMAYACKTSSARKIVGVVPYMPYCKQSKMRKRGSIVSKLLAAMLSKSGRENTYDVFN